MGEQSLFCAKGQADRYLWRANSWSKFHSRCVCRVFLMLRVHFKNHFLFWLHSLCFDSCPRAVSMHSGFLRNHTKLRDVILLLATRQPNPGISVELAPKVQQLAVGVTRHLFALGICFFCTAWPGKPDLDSAFPAEVQQPAEQSPGSCTCDGFLILARTCRNTESSPTSRFCEWYRLRFHCLCKSEMTLGTIRC